LFGWKTILHIIFPKTLKTAYILAWGIMNLKKLEILEKLAFKPELKFSQLKLREVPSNLLAYYVKTLENQGFIRKKEGKYALTLEGVRKISFLSEKKLEPKQQAILGVIIVVEKGGKYLISRRKKEPFRTYHGFTHGRLNFGEDVLQGARRILLERTGLTGDFELKGMWVVKTLEYKKLMLDHHHYVIKCSNPQGSLNMDNEFFTNKWVSQREFSEIERFKDDDYILGIVKGKDFKLLQAERTFKKGKEVEVIVAA
jgi:hypothetical protein